MVSMFVAKRFTLLAISPKSFHAVFEVVKPVVLPPVFVLHASGKFFMYIFGEEIIH